MESPREQRDLPVTKHTRVLVYFQLKNKKGVFYVSYLLGSPHWLYDYLRRNQPSHPHLKQGLTPALLSGGLGFVGSLRAGVVREVPRKSCELPERCAYLKSNSLK